MPTGYSRANLHNYPPQSLRVQAVSPLSSPDGTSRSLSTARRARDRLAGLLLGFAGDDLLELAVGRGGEEDPK